MVTRRSINTERAPRAIGPYAQGVAAGGFLFLSGQVPLDPATGEMVRGSLQDEVSRVLENLKAVLQAAGATFDQVVRTTIFLTDLRDFEEMNAAYARYFGETRPARSTIQVAALPRGARVEIDAIARLE
jgi:2-iminobutanoate/2-iminopropanoate deaminase